MNQTEIAGLVIALLGGAAVGLERQWSGHADGPTARFAGIRTFTLLGVLGGLSGVLWNAGITVPSAILLAGAVLIVAAAYAAASKTDIDGTTEVAALVVLAAGTMAGLGSLRLASGIFALLALILVEKSRLHALARRIDDVGLRSGVRFGVMALVVLPLLPEGPYGPLGGIRPRSLWSLVLFFCGLSFAGFVARRIAGASHGYLATGFLGGMVSSTNTTLVFARESRAQPTVEYALAFGAVAANIMLVPRVIVATAILGPAVVQPLLYYLIPPAVFAGLVLLWYRRPSTAGPELPARNPLQLGQALQMTALFQVVLFVVNLARNTWGASGVLVTAAILGLTDVDALTMSMARDVASALTPATAAAGIAIGVSANTVVKLGIAVVFGSRRFKVVVGGALLLMLSALVGVLAINNWR